MINLHHRVRRRLQLVRIVNGERSNNITSKSRCYIPSSYAPPLNGILQRKCACGSGTTSLTGECAECKSKKHLQAKLAIGASNDPLEQEADRIADQVMAAPAHSAVSGAPPRIQRFTGQANRQTDTAPASVDHVLASSGRPLDPALRQDMEQRFGHDFSQVRVHSGAAAEQSARDVNAHAYTVGHNIVFGAGRFAPGTHEGRRLLAHELTHVVQQEAHGHPLLSRVPTGPSKPPGTAASANSPQSVEGLMSKVIGGLNAQTKRTLMGDPEGKGTGYTTLAISELAHLGSDGKVVELEYRWATNDNWSNPNLREVTAALGLEQLTDMTPLSKVGEHHAEALTVDATSRRVVLTALCVSRKVCLGCQQELIELAERSGLVLTYSKQGSLSVIQFSVKSKTGTTEGGSQQGPAAAATAKRISPGEVRRAMFGASASPESLSEGLGGAGTKAPSINAPPLTGKVETPPGAQPGARPAPIRTAAGRKTPVKVGVRVARAGRRGSQGGSASTGVMYGLTEALLAVLGVILANYLSEHYQSEIDKLNEKTWKESLEKLRPGMERVIAQGAAQIQRWQEDGCEVSLLVVVRSAWSDSDIGSILSSLWTTDVQLAAEGLPVPSLKGLEPPSLLASILNETLNSHQEATLLRLELEGTRSDVRRLREIGERLAAQGVGEEERSTLREERDRLTDALPEGVLPPGPHRELAATRPAPAAAPVGAAERAAAIATKRQAVRALEQPSPVLNSEQRADVGERLRTARVELRLLGLEQRRGSVFDAPKRAEIRRMLKDVVFYEWKAEREYLSPEERQHLSADERARLESLRQKLDEATLR